MQNLNWQNLFPEKCREVTINIDGEIHRADILLNNGLVIEIQNSPIKIEQIVSREEFYGKNKMIWILNGQTLASNSKLEINHFAKNIHFSFNLPANIYNLPRYNIEEFTAEIFTTEVFILLKQKSISYNVEKKCDFYFIFNEKLNFELIENSLKKQIRDIFIKKYCNNNRNGLSIFDILFKINYNTNEEDKADGLLKKNNWRKFMDCMKFPVVIDNLDGLNNDCLFWYQKNKIVKKSNFVEKYSKLV